MKAIVTVDTYYQSDDGSLAIRYLPGDEIEGKIAEIAVEHNWAKAPAQPKPQPAAQKGKPN